ncbi:MAG: cryptochrome/photolyase family protein [Pseudomonadota bacterium]
MVSGPAPRVLLVLGDQLTPTVAALARGDRARDVVLMAEVREEATYVPHHRKKLAFLFSAMRHFAEELREAGWRVDYVRLDDPENAGSLAGEARRALERHGAAGLVATEPGEWRLRSAMEGWEAALGRPVKVLRDDRFLASQDAFAAWAEGRKQLRMEYFYREMRRAHGVLMEGDKPAGGKWNYDHDNRKPPKAGLAYPEVPRFQTDAVTREVLELVEGFDGGWGDLSPFWFAVTRAEAEAAAERFFAEALPRFGDYQDAMVSGQAFLFHSVISLYLNAGLLEPLALCRRAEAEWREGRAPLNAAEGFVRQILGWREFVRGIYWREGPGYAQRNALGAEAALPAFYWTGETDMACMAAAIGQTRAEAYAHHIQRLMVTGNFALLAGLRPQEVAEWYLAVYADAYEWVEAPNVIGMALYADGGVLASKPYAASGSYIDRMSDYCGGCRYEVKARSGPEACPFNPLYWDFMVRNRARLQGNPRVSRVYSTWDRMGEDKKAAALESAAEVRARLEAGARV